VLLRFKPGDAVDAFSEYGPGLGRRGESVGFPKLPVAEEGPNCCHAFARPSASGLFGVVPAEVAVYLLPNGVGRVLPAASYAD
jgi:hypothetical protein